MLHELTAGPSVARPAPKRSFLPEFADERNTELDREIQASGQRRRSGLRGRADSLPPPPPPPPPALAAGHRRRTLHPAAGAGGRAGAYADLAGRE